MNVCLFVEIVVWPCSLVSGLTISTTIWFTLIDRYLIWLKLILCIWNRFIGNQSIIKSIKNIDDDCKKHSHHQKCWFSDFQYGRIFLFVLSGFPVDGYFYPNTSLSFENLFFSMLMMMKSVKIAKKKNIYLVECCWLWMFECLIQNESKSSSPSLFDFMVMTFVDEINQSIRYRWLFFQDSINIYLCVFCLFECLLIFLTFFHLHSWHLLA